MYKQKPSDLVFFTGTSILSKLILWFTRSPGEPKSYASHVGGVLVPYTLLEALIKVEKTPFDPENYTDFEIWRCNSLSEDDAINISSKANEYFGRSYGFLKLLTHGMDALLTKVFRKEIFFFRKLNHKDRYPICSWVWAFAFNRAYYGYTFGIDPEYATPDDMHDFVKSDSDWELVYKN
jgi:hypothetical protein